MFSSLFTASRTNEQARVSAGLRAVQFEQPNERQCSSSPPFRGVNTERAEQTWENKRHGRAHSPCWQDADTRCPDGSSRRIADPASQAQAATRYRHNPVGFFRSRSENAFTVLTVCTLSGSYLSHTVRETLQKAIFDALFHAAPQCNLGICLHWERNVLVSGNQKS